MFTMMKNTAATEGPQLAAKGIVIERFKPEAHF